MNPFHTLPFTGPATTMPTPCPEADPGTPPEELRRLANDPDRLGAVLRNPNAPIDLLFDRWPAHPEAFLENPIVALWRLQGYLMPFDTEQRGWKTPGLDALQWPKGKYSELCHAIAVHLCREGRLAELKTWVPDRGNWIDPAVSGPQGALALTQDPDRRVRLKLAEHQGRSYRGWNMTVAWPKVRTALLKDPEPEVVAVLAPVVTGEADQRLALEEGLRSASRSAIVQALAKNPALHEAVLRGLLLRSTELQDPELVISELRRGHADRSTEDRHPIAIVLGPDGQAFREQDRLRYHGLFSRVAQERPALRTVLAAHPGVQGALRAELMADPDPAVHLDALRGARFHLLYHRAAEGKPLPKHRGRIHSCLTQRPHDLCPLCRAADTWITDPNATEAHKALASNPSLPIDMAERLLAKGEPVREAMVNYDTRESILNLVIEDAPADLLIEEMRYLAFKYGPKKLLRRHPDPAVRIALANNLTKCYRDRSGVREQLAVDPDERVRNALLRGLRTTRQADKGALALLGQDSDPLIRFTLTMTGKGRRKELATMLRDPLPGIRYAAVRSTSCTEKEHLFLAADPYPRIRLLVARDFGSCDGHYAKRTTGINHYVRNHHRRDWHSPVWDAYWALVPDDPHAPVRREAAGTFDLPVSVLERLVNDPDPEVRALLVDRPVWHTAQAAVARHWDLKLPDLRKARRTKPYVRAQLATLTNLAPSRLEQFAADPHWYVRARLAFNPRTTPALLERLAADPDPLVAEAAQRARTFRKL